MTQTEYRDKLYQDVFSLTPNIPGGYPANVLPYFEGHWPRFVAQLDMFEEHIKERIESVLDVGTGVPFSSYWFALRKNALVKYGCPLAGLPSVSDRVRYIQIDLCAPPPIEKYDVVIATEVIEHLPCNTYRVRQWLTESAQKYLLLSFPLGGMNAGWYEHDDMGDKTRIHDEHIREYTEETARAWYIGTGFDLVSEAITFTSAYGGNIMNVLLRRRWS